MGGLKGVLKGQLKSWIPRMKEEVVEEGLQSAASDAFHNALLALRPSSKEQSFTVGEIVGNAGGAMLEAAPSVIGMVLSATRLQTLEACGNCRHCKTQQ